MPRTLHKPAGLTVFPPHRDAAGDCLLARLLDEEPARAALDWPEGFAGGIAHRLDTSTSGAVVVADDPTELEWLRSLFTAHRLVKTYRLLAARSVPWDHNRCTRAIAHARRRRGRMVVQRGRATAHRGRWYPAETSFQRLGGDLFQARMSTGVMHQIRVHAAFLGIPLVGDRVYGGGDPPPHAPEGVVFFLHHVGLRGPEGFQSAPVPLPAWAEVPLRERGDR